MFPVRRQINRHAARLRRDQTDAERRFWHAVRNRQLAEAKFRRQATIGPFVADFVCIEAMLIVELDGGQHDDAGDRERTSFLQAHGYRVLRFWNNDVLDNLHGVLAVVSTALAERTGRKTLTQPSPAKAGEG